MTRSFAFLFASVLLISAGVTMSDPPDPKEESVLDHAYPYPIAEQVPSEPGIIAVDMEDGSGHQTKWDMQNIIGHTLKWASDSSVLDEAIAIGWVPDMYEACHKLRDNPLVEACEHDDIMFIQGWKSTGFTKPNDPLYEKQWHLDAMGAPYGWANSPAGEGVIVAVIDTGATQTSDLIDTKFLPGKSFTGEPMFDGNGHGTHVAGTIAQATNNGIGTAGIAPNATILPVKVLSNYGSGSASGIASGIDWAVDQGAQVINLSLGGSYSKIIHLSIQKAVDDGVIVVAAMGNDGSNQANYPGGLEETIGVSALGPTGELSFYSTHGKGTDIAAPGGDKQIGGEAGGVLQQTTKDSESYQYFQGTSMATPHVVGAAAVLLSTGMTSEEVENALYKSSTGYEGGWTEKFGYGKLDLEQALRDNGSGWGDWANWPWPLVVVVLLLALLLGWFAEFNNQSKAWAAFSGIATAAGLSWIAGPFILWFWTLGLVSTSWIFAFKGARPWWTGALIATAAFTLFSGPTFVTVATASVVAFLALSIAGIERKNQSS